MELIIPATIKKTELKPLEKVFSLEIIKIAAKKSLQGLGENIKSSTKISGTVLNKVYLTGTSGAGRAIFLLQIALKKSALVMIRLKKDKQIGANMAIENPKFKRALDKNLSLTIRNIENGNFEEYRL